MLRKETLLMRVVVIFIGIVVLVFSIFLFPEISRSASAIAQVASEKLASLFRYVNVVFVIGLYSAAVPFFLALYQALKLLNYIDKKNAFSGLSVAALKKIKYYALAVCALYMVGVMPMIYCVADLDDAPGLIMIGFIIGLVPAVVATFAAILQKLLQEAIDIKSENDLTI